MPELRRKYRGYNERYLLTDEGITKMIDTPTEAIAAKVEDILINTEQILKKNFSPTRVKLIETAGLVCMFYISVNAIDKIVTRLYLRDRKR